MLADLIWPIYLDTLGLFVSSLIGLAIIILIEATVLRLLHWGSWKIAFLHAFTVNLMTALIGTALLLFFRFISAALAIEHPSPALFIGAFLLTVILEAVGLKVLRQSARFARVTLNSLVANIFSYVFVGTIIYLTLTPVGYKSPHRSYLTPPPGLPSASPWPAK
jgi:predicted membrane channel-forming protein YqfA (hemolysin III family)